MANLQLLLQHSAIYGAILSAVMFVVIMISLYVCPELWIGDAPADIQERFGPISARAKRQKLLFAIPLFLLIAGLLIHSIIRLAQLGEFSFGAIFLSIFVIVQIFNLFDLLIIDWLLIATIRPRFMLLPGTEDMQSYSDYGFYFRGFLKGLVGSLIVSPVIAGLALGIDAIV